MTERLKAPFPYFGGKSSVADIVWQRFGEVRNSVEPFFGSGAALLARPQPFDGTETVNDLDGMISNFWRSVQAAPDEVARWADWPVNENDLTARHIWLVSRKDSLQNSLEGDPNFYDAKVAGWWCWGMCCWIGSGFCSGKGPWTSVDGQLVHLGTAGNGVNRQLVHLGTAGNGVNRKRVHLGNAGQGVNRKRVHLGNAGQGCNGDGILPVNQGIYDWMRALALRFQRVRVCCGDWSRVCGPTPTVKQGLTAIFLDPPYSAEAGRNNNLYRIESITVAHDVREWALEWGKDSRMRIALCGYEDEHDMPSDWETYEWKAPGGYECQGDTASDERNAHRERIWFSPHCVKPDRVEQLNLFAP